MNGKKRQLYQAYGMDSNIIMGYFTWLGNAVRGNFGDSWSRTGQTVIQVFNSVIWYSFALGAASFILEIVNERYTLGIIYAKKQYSKTDYAVTFIALLGNLHSVVLLGDVIKMDFFCKTWMVRFIWYRGKKPRTAQ